jgi:hypothetical protein
MNFGAEHLEFKRKTRTYTPKQRPTSGMVDGLAG